jgi:two-component system, sensor histidine kinase LadS
MAALLTILKNKQNLAGRIIFLFQFFFTVLINSSAQEVLKISSIEQANEQIGSSLYIFEDTTNNIDFSSITLKKELYLFTPFSQFRRKISAKNTYWLYFSIKNSLSKDSPLGLFIPKQNHIVDVIALSDSSFYSQRTGFFINGVENDEIIPFTNIVQIGSANSLDFYIKIKNINDELPNFSIRLVDIRTAVKQGNRIANLDCFALGMMLLMLFYGLFLFSMNRSKVFLYYSVYVLFIVLFFLGSMGLGYRIFPGFPRKIFPYSDIPLFLGFIFYIQFVRLFINTSQVIPKWDKVLRLCQIINLLEAIRIPIFVYLTNLVITNYTIENGVGIFINIFSFAFLVRLIFLKTKLTNIVAIGSTFLVLGNLISAILFVMFLDDSVYIYLKTGVLLELIVYTFGISLRYNLMEDDKHKLQGQLIAQLSKNAELHEKVNRELADKVKERTLEIEAQRDIVISQKNHIEKINTEITDSINYAKYIQSSILPKTDQLDSNLGEHFVLYKPKDIVSGDFYWISNTDDKTIIAAVDCTGHGVPGAFMSMLGIALLNEIVNKEYITHPGVILRRLRKEVIRSLQQKGETGEQKDGMDIALCSIDLVNMKLQFAGANNPLYLIRNSNLENVGVLRYELSGDDRLYEIKGDFMPIGIHDRMDDFRLHEIEIYKGDSFYIFTDGFPDQFGGPDCKKFGYRQFRELLLKSYSKPMPNQKTSLEEAFNEWRGTNSQIDDILVIGFRIS